MGRDAGSGGEGAAGGGGGQRWGAGSGGKLGFPPRNRNLYQGKPGLRVDLRKLQGLFCKNGTHESPTASCGHRLSPGALRS
jgi:hypothetical protein